MVTAIDVDPTMLARTTLMQPPMGIRSGLALALHDAREVLSAQGKPAGFKAMGALIGTAPRRLSEICSDEFRLNFGPSDSPKSEHAVAKTIIGFASSIYKVVEWLAQTLPPDDATITMESLLHAPEGQRAQINLVALNALLREFWPSDCFDYHFEAQQCQHWVSQGISLAQGELARTASLSIIVSVVEWGPFSTPVFGHAPGSARRRRSIPNQVSLTPPKLPIIDSPIGNYGSSLLAAIDPVQFRPDVDGLFVKRSLRDALSGLPSSKTGMWQVALGVYDSLYRQYEGYQFVTMPIATPIMALQIGDAIGSTIGGPSEFERLSFVDLFSESDDTIGDFEIFVIPREAGHLAIGKISDPQKIRTLSGEGSKPLDIVTEIFSRRDRTLRTYFVSDSILCYSIYKSIKSSQPESSVRCLYQDRPSDFAFRIGFMVREQDIKLLRMLHLAQKEIFRSPAKAKNLIAHLSAATSAWASDLTWPFPFFVIDSDCMDEMSRDARSRCELVDFVERQTNNFFELEI